MPLDEFGALSELFVYGGWAYPAASIDAFGEYGPCGSPEIEPDVGPECSLSAVTLSFLRFRRPK
jgi:hypothetical protein